MLMCVTASAVTGTEITDGNAGSQLNAAETIQNRDMWDIVFTFDAGDLTGSLYLVGLGFDGTYFYCPTFNSPTIYRFNKDGTYLDSFSITGVPNLIDLTYDGTYFYGQGQSPTNVIYQMDFTNKTLIGTIPSPHAAWNIAYDADHDGFWIGQWQSYLSLISRTGAVLDTISPVPESCLGLAWDPWTTIEGYDGPFLWIFTGTSTGGQGIIKVIDLATKTIVPGVQRNVATEIRMGIAGGLEFTTDYQEGIGVLMGMIQGADPLDDLAFGYEVCTTIVNDPPETPGAPSGPTNGIIDVEYSFTASTTDPEGDDIYYWFDWDDGTNSGWVGPYTSGATATASHTWTAVGDYDITVKAKDEFDHESEVSPAHTITIVESPILKVEWIMGGLFKVKTLIKNVGGLTANNIAWSITLEGGAFIGKETTGTIASLEPGAGETVSSKFILGFGATLVKVTATIPESSDTKEAEGTVLLFFIKI